VRINGVSSLAITKLDVLDGLAEIKVCTGYRYRRKLLREFPTEDRILAECEPAFETLPGWQESTGKVRKWQDLPPRAREYLEYIESLTGAPIGIVSVGSQRDQTIFRHKYFN